MEAHTRKVTPVTEHPGPLKLSKLRMWGYNADAIAAMTGQCRTTVKRHIRAKVFDPESFLSAAAYVAERRARNEKRSKR